MSNILGLASGILTLVAFVPYIVSIKKNRTRPSRATWFVWMILGVILAASYQAAGASESNWMARADAVGYTAIFLLSLIYGEGGWSSFDRWCLFLMVIGLLFWRLTGEPEIAFLSVLVIDGAGMLPTIKKTFTNPETEDSLSWFLWGIGAALNLAAVVIAGQLDFVIVIYPLYFTMGTLTVALLSWDLLRAKCTRRK